MVFTHHIRTLLGVSALLVVPLTACQKEETPAANAGEATAPQATPVAEQTGDIGPSPVNEKTLREEAEWAEAVDGLDFSTGTVVLRHPPANSDAQTARTRIADGDTEMVMNHRIPAVKAYADAVRAAPDMPEAHMKLGEAMIAKGKTDLALACFRTVLELDPDHAPAQFELAMTYGRDGQFEQAITEMERVLELQPDNGAAHERIAMWRYYSNDYAGAWAQVHEAEAIGHKMPPQFLDLLGSKMPDPGSVSSR
jgi:tetratricopeptide (TPR) repeat protein